MDLSNTRPARFLVQQQSCADSFSFLIFEGPENAFSARHEILRTIVASQSFDSATGAPYSRPSPLETQNLSCDSILHEVTETARRSDTKKWEGENKQKFLYRIISEIQ